MLAMLPMEHDGFVIVRLAECTIEACDQVLRALAQRQDSMRVLSAAMSEWAGRLTISRNFAIKLHQCCGFAVGFAKIVVFIPVLLS